MDTAELQPVRKTNTIFAASHNTMKGPKRSSQKSETPTNTGQGVPLPSQLRFTRQACSLFCRHMETTWRLPPSLDHEFWFGANGLEMWQALWRSLGFQVLELLGSLKKSRWHINGTESSPPDLRGWNTNLFFSVVYFSWGTLPTKKGVRKGTTKEPS